ncbi:hypothetical protein IWX90DRAFT_419553 [Phyllosticta citrichinensis]|uniref:Uncharacterized protein n=1 Tax=Phyllosticta citrichinensis TaxID=1130410 RepID=A0ABR1Y4S8_9PEZI
MAMATARESATPWSPRCPPALPPHTLSHRDARSHRYLPASQHQARPSMTSTSRCPSCRLLTVTGSALRSCSLSVPRPVRIAKQQRRGESSTHTDGTRSSSSPPRRATVQLLTRMRRAQNDSPRPSRLGSEEEDDDGRTPIHRSRTPSCTSSLARSLEPTRSAREGVQKKSDEPRHQTDETRRDATCHRHPLVAGAVSFYSVTRG